MINVSNNTLKVVSALVWIAGGIILFYKGYIMLKQANTILFNIELISAVMVTAFIIGLLKNKYLMTPFTAKNLERIQRLDQPKIIQIFEPIFFFYLTLMIITGISISKLAEGSYTALLIVGGIDLALSTALLKSSVLFLKNETKE